MYHCILRFQLPIKGLCIAVMVPPAIKPYGSDRPIVGKQLCKLRVHEVVIACPVGFLFLSACPKSCSSLRIIFSSPVQMRIIEVQFNTVSLAGIGHFLDDIPLERCCIYRVISAGRGFEKRETIVVARCYRDIFCPGSLDCPHPGICIKL